MEKKAKKAVKQRDRISYSRGAKVSTGNYGSVDVHVSYSTDVAEGETPDECLKRAAKFVDKAHKRKLAKVVG